MWAGLKRSRSTLRLASDLLFLGLNGQEERKDGSYMKKVAWQEM